MQRPIENHKRETDLGSCEQEWSMTEGETMVNGLRLDIEPAGSGWMTVRLTSADLALEFIASYTPRDSVRDLASAAAEFVAGAPDQVVTWNLEPVEYEFRFTVAGDRSRLEVWK